MPPVVLAPLDMVRFDVLEPIVTSGAEGADTHQDQMYYR